MSKLWEWVHAVLHAVVAAVLSSMTGHISTPIAWDPDTSSVDDESTEQPSSSSSDT